MRKAAPVAVLLGFSLMLLAALLEGRPFDRINLLLDAAFRVAPRWAEVEWLVRDDRHQELTRGERPRESFSKLDSVWRAWPGRKRVVFLGNSQMMAVSLAAGEGPPQAPEPTWVDQVSAALEARSPEPELAYRLAAPGLSYAEALWYLHYLLLKPGLHPTRVVLQLNYQAFWNSGIRSGMLELLDDPAFRAAIEEEARSPAAYGESLHEALAAWRQRRLPGGQGSPGGPAAAGAERAVRKWLDRWPAFAERRLHKDDFLELLYRLRVYFLGLKPTTARTVSGVRLASSQQVIERMARLCRDRGVELVLFHAPLNPAVLLYRTATDRTQYRSWVDGLAARYPVRLVDLEQAIPAAEWGSWMNGPDPLHLGRQGHRHMAQLFLAALDSPQPER